MNSTGMLYLRKRRRPTRTQPRRGFLPVTDTQITVMDSQGGVLGDKYLQASAAVPVHAGGRVMWRTEAGTFDTDALAASAPVTPAIKDPNIGVQNQLTYFFEL